MSKKVCKVKQGLLLLCCMVAATGCKQAPPAQMETEYEVMTVSPADRMISSAYSATIRGRQDIDIYPQVSGTLTKVCVTEGQRVKNGQTLFIIDQVRMKLLCRRQWQTLNRPRSLWLQRN
jgi:efflux transporter, RND family, MFP subunit